MANISAEQRALNFVALFEQSGRSVASVTIKGKELSFTLKDEAEPANSFDRAFEMEALNGKK